MMSESEVAALDERARAVGEVIGWRLGFVLVQRSGYGALVAGPDRIAILGPSSLSEMVAHDVELTLDSLERGEHVIFADEDGDPRLGLSA